MEETGRKDISEQDGIKDQQRLCQAILKLS